MPSFDPVRSLVRGLDVLRAVSEGGPITASEIARIVQLPQPTVYRLLETLVSAGYVARLGEGQKYEVTGRTVALSRGFEPGARLVEMGKPFVEQLRQQIGWPSNLAIFDGDAMIIGYSNRAAFGLSISGRTGARIPLLATGVGLACLAHLDKKERQVALARLSASTDRWDKDPRLWKNLPERLAAIRRQGYAVADEEYLDAVYQSRIWAVAVPIIRDGAVAGGLSSLVLRLGGDRARLIDGMLPALQQTAARIAALLQSDYD